MSSNHQQVELNSLVGQRKQFVYRNYRGDTATRDVTIISFLFGSTEYHPEVQVLMMGFDHDRNNSRIYAVKDILAWLEG